MRVDAVSHQGATALDCARGFGFFLFYLLKQQQRRAWEVHGGLGETKRPQSATRAVVLTHRSARIRFIFVPEISNEDDLHVVYVELRQNLQPATVHHWVSCGSSPCWVLDRRYLKRRSLYLPPGSRRRTFPLTLSRLCQSLGFGGHYYHF